MSGNVAEGVPKITNTVKCRDDAQPVILETVKEAAAGAPRFKLNGSSGCSWARADEVFGAEKLRPRIEPWLTALCQSEHFSLLLGSGLTHAIHHVGTGGMLPGMSAGDFGAHDALIKAEATKSASTPGALAVIEK